MSAAQLHQNCHQSSWNQRHTGNGWPAARSREFGKLWSTCGCICEKSTWNGSKWGTRETGSISEVKSNGAVAKEGSQSWDNRAKRINVACRKWVWFDSSIFGAQIYDSQWSDLCLESRVYSTSNLASFWQSSVTWRLLATNERIQVCKSARARARRVDWSYMNMIDSENVSISCY